MSSRGRLIRRWLAWTAAGASFWSAPPALAADAAGGREDWYGSETLAADAGALLLFFAGVATNDRDTSQAVVLGAGAAYLLGSPTVHLLHERGLASLGSLGLRAGLPVAGGLAGALLSRFAPPNDGDEVVIGTVFGVAGGLLSAVVLDAALLAWQPERSTGAAPPPRSFAWRPSLTLTETCAELSVMGHF